MGKPWSHKRVVAFWIAISTGFLVLTTPLICRFWQLVEFSTQRDAAVSLIEELRNRCPSDVNPQQWELGVGWTRTAIYNIYSSADASASRDLQQFTKDTREKLNESIDKATINWVWIRLSKSGPYGLEYTTKHDSDFRSSLHP